MNDVGFDDDFDAYARTVWHAHQPQLDSLFGLLGSAADDICKFLDENERLRTPDCLWLLMVLSDKAEDSRHDGMTTAILRLAALLVGGRHVATPPSDALPRLPLLIGLLRNNDASSDECAQAAACVDQLVGPTALESYHNAFAAAVRCSVAELCLSLFEETNDRRWLHDGVACAAASVEHASPDNRLQTRRLSIYSRLLSERYDRTAVRSLPDLRRAIDAARTARRLAEPTSDDELGALLDLERALSLRARTPDEISWLKEAVSVASDAIDLATRLGHGQGDAATSHANALLELDMWTPLSQSQLESTLQALEDARQRCRAGSGEWAGLLGTSAEVNRRLYDKTGQQDYLSQAFTAANLASGAWGPGGAMALRVADLKARLLLDYYEASGSRAQLDQARLILDLAIDSANTSDPDIDLAQLSAANVYQRLHALSDDLSALHHAVALVRRAASHPRIGGPRRARHLLTLSAVLSDLSHYEDSPRLLHQALATDNKALALVDPRDRTGTLVSIARRELEMFHATTDRAWLDQAVARANQALLGGDPTGTVRDRALITLGGALLDMCELTESRDQREAARAALSSATGVEATEWLTLTKHRARLARHDGDLREAINQLKAARSHFHAEARLLRDDHVRLRDLAGGAEGILGDLAACLVLDGREREARELLDEARVWLPAPKDDLLDTPMTDRSVVWVIPSNWETVILQTAASATILPATRQTFFRAVKSLRRAVRVGRFDHAATQLVAHTSSVVQHLAPAEHLLIVPVGLSAMLPFAAGVTSRGTHLIQEATVAQAASLSWARASRRPRPGSGGFAAFHAGEPPLDLEDERSLWVDTDLRVECLESPTGEEVMGRLQATQQLVAHFGCHGFYNALHPLESALHLSTQLTIANVLGADSCTWLVNLSACETAVPDVSRAEQHISFPMAFVAAGAAHVIATLWPVANADAVEYNAAFYASLRTGMSVADAHRTALLNLRQSIDRGTRALRTRPPRVSTHNRHSHEVRRWAAFVHYGH